MLNFGYMLDRKQKAFSDKDVEYITDVFIVGEVGLIEDVNGKFIQQQLKRLKNKIIYLHQVGM